MFDYAMSVTVKEGKKERKKKLTTREGKTERKIVTTAALSPYLTRSLLLFHYYFYSKCNSPEAAATLYGKPLVKGEYVSYMSTLLYWCPGGFLQR